MRELIQTEGLPPDNFGWLGVDEKQTAFARQFPRLSQAGPALFLGDAPKTTLLYKAFVDILGKHPEYPAQQIGDCVSFSHAHANDLLQCIEIGLGEDMDFRETDTEFIYGASREVAGILGMGDGSYNSAAIKAMTTVGIVSREMLGADGVYSGKRAKSWGYYGPPENIKQMASKFRLQASAIVSTWDELVAAITNGYPVTIATSRGFAMTRDRQGFCQLEGRWGHSMCVAAVRFDRPGACILQSWGPKQPEGPTDLDQPTWSFWAERPAIEAILSEGDSLALSKTPGFVKKPIPARWNFDAAAFPRVA